MKVTTTNGETLRKEFTAIEAAALKHAAEHCEATDIFTGVPSSNEERYRNSTEQFRVDAKEDGIVTIFRYRKAKTLTAKYYADGEPKPKPAPKSEPKPEAKSLPEQYDSMKEKHPDAVLLFRVGDFYETFKEDAQTVSEILGITLTKRLDGTLIAGFPHHALDTYLPKLIRAGRRVAICEDSESKPKEIVSPKTEPKDEIPKESTPEASANDGQKAFLNGLQALINAQMGNCANEELKAEITGAKFLISALTARIEALESAKPIQRELTIQIGDMSSKIEGVTHPKFEDVLEYVANHQNVYLYGPAGSGKNVICEQLAKALEVPFYYQNTILTKFDLTGYKNAAGEFEETEFFKAWTQGGVFMLDEADNATAEALVTLNAALANGYYTFPGIGRVECSENFYCVAAGNTNGQGATDEYCGRYKMDESSRDRFFFTEIEYDPRIEEAIAGEHTDVLDFVRELRSVAKEQRISMICGYRAIKNLVRFYHKEPKTMINDAILKGAEKDTVRELASRLNGNNRYVEAFKELAY